MAKALSKAAQRAIRKHGKQPCEWAYYQSQQGEGPSFIGGGNARVGDAMINAGRELAAGRK